MNHTSRHEVIDLCNYQGWRWAFHPNPGDGGLAHVTVYADDVQIHAANVSIEAACARVMEMLGSVQAAMD